MKRDKLPFRVNCEGYFIDNKGKVLARDTGDGYIVFPGGGVDNGESPEKALLREVKEETEANVKIIRKLGVLNFIWPDTWATTEKQRKRYREFKGEEIHLFFGEVESFDTDVGESEDYWKGEKLKPIGEIIKIIESKKPYNENIKEYREFQVNSLKSFKK